MKYPILKNRSELLAIYLTENKTTVRETARHFGISKSTVHKDLREKLPKVNKPLYVEAVKVLDINRSERHLRGGMATKDKYEKLRSAENRK